MPLELNQLASLDVMGLFHWLITHVTPLFIVSSPVTSFADQIYSIHKTRSSAGFSLDIPLIMLVASTIKVYYWLGYHYEVSLLLQALLAIIVQSILLHVALTNRPSSSASYHAPFADDSSASRPYNFWRWRQSRPYWVFLIYLAAGLTFLQLFIGSIPAYASLLGYMALAIEATLPVPQILANEKRRTCKGFRLSVLANWLLGDAFKMMFFFAKDSSAVPWAFKLCGIFQACCDCYLGVQYWRFGNGAETGIEMGPL